MRRHVLSTCLAGAVLAALAATAQGPVLASTPAEQPARWIQADDLRVRAGPGLEHPVVGVLQRGSQVVLKSRQDVDGFCLVEGDGQYGHVACQYLSADPVPRPRAGLGDIPIDRRWVVGTAVNLRLAPERDAPVLTRLALHRSVRLLRSDAGAGYCEVQPLDRAGSPEGASGYTACQYLAPEPLTAAQVAGADADTERAFWRSPGWPALEAHAQALASALPDAAAGPWPRNEALERMKAHLALGLQAAAPPALPDWGELKALAAAHDPALLNSGARRAVWAGTDRDLQAREQRAANAAQRLQMALGLEGPLHDTISAEGGGARVISLVRALELPSVGASMFRREADIAPPGDGAVALSGRFGRIYRTLVAPRIPRPGEPPDAGLYDMLGHTQVLTRPVQQVRLFRDGTLQSLPTTARRTQQLWRDVDEPMCAGWVAGFAHGDADPPIWRFFSDPGSGAGQGAARQAQRASRQHNPAGSLFAYHALTAPPRQKAQRSEQVAKLDRAGTGFVSVTQMGFDLDADGVTDLLVLENLGPGAGHLDGPTGSDDRWHRVLLANIGGRWKILGTDRFSYGCGC